MQYAEKSVANLNFGDKNSEVKYLSQASTFGNNQNEGCKSVPSAFVKIPDIQQFLSNISIVHANVAPNQANQLSHSSIRFERDNNESKFESLRRSEGFQSQILFNKINKRDNKMLDLNDPPKNNSLLAL